MNAFDWQKLHRISKKLGRNAAPALFFDPDRNPYGRMLLVPIQIHTSAGSNTAMLKKSNFKEDFPFLTGGGEMGRRIREYDWASTPLGQPSGWPQSLRSALSICLHSSFPTAIYWGPDLRLLYNDAWSPIPAERHPWALGRPGAEVWPDIWEVVGPQFSHVMETGEGFSTFDQMLPMVREGIRHETYWNYSFTPIRGEDGSVVGIFNQGNETTQNVLAQRNAEAEIERLANMFAEAPSAVTILRGPSHIIEVANEASLAMLGRTDVIGKTVIEAVPEVVGQGFVALLDQVFESGEPHIGRAVPVSLERVKGKPPETRLIDFIYQPLTDKAGNRTGIFVQSTDVTEAARAEEKFRESEEKYEAITNTIDQMVWSTRPDGYHDFYNDRWYEYTGVTRGSTDGEEWNGMFHPDDQQRAMKVWKHSLKTGEPYHIEYRLRHKSGQYRWVIGRAQCVRNSNGDIVRWYGTCTDVHDLKEAEEKRQLLLREMNHRVKNLFAVAAGMVSMTARTATSVREMADTLRGRLSALARAHEMIRSAISRDAEEEQPIALKALIEQILEPHVDLNNGEQITIDGTHIEIGADATTSFALIFHELATNAAKYGALSSHTGELKINWNLTDEMMELNWLERVSGVVVTEPSATGFGMTLARSSATGHLGGTVGFEWYPDGMAATLKVPLDRLNR